MSTSGWSSLGLWKQCYCFRRKQPYWFSVAVSCESVLLDFVNQHYMSYYLSVKIVIHLFQWGMAVSMYNLYRCVQSHSVDSTVTNSNTKCTHTHTDKMHNYGHHPLLRYTQVDKGAFRVTPVRDASSWSWIWKSWQFFAEQCLMLGVNSRCERIGGEKERKKERKEKNMWQPVKEAVGWNTSRACWHMF